MPLLTDTTYEAFFGGIPDDVDLMSGVTAHKGSYIGCIRDLVLLEEYVDWEAEATITGATLSDCDVQEVVQISFSFSFKFLFPGCPDDNHGGALG